LKIQTIVTNNDRAPHDFVVKHLDFDIVGAWEQPGKPEAAISL
jgi:hypothetical protein